MGYDLFYKKDNKAFYEIDADNFEIIGEKLLFHKNINGKRVNIFLCDISKVDSVMAHESNLLRYFEEGDETDD